MNRARCPQSSGFSPNVKDYRTLTHRCLKASQPVLSEVVIYFMRDVDRAISFCEELWLNGNIERLFTNEK